MNCPHCGMPLYKKVGDVKFFCCGSSVGTRVEPITDACREIARLKEQNAMLETVAMQGADERNSLKVRVQDLENKLNHVNLAFAEYVKKEIAR